MRSERFEALAAELAAEQPELAKWIDAVRGPTESLRDRTAAAVEAFVARARELGAAQLTDVRVSAVEPDLKHVDCLQFSVERGRHVLLCVAIANSEGGKVRLVGPFRRGKVEGPCSDHSLSGAELDGALETRLLDLLREASAA